MYAKLLASKTRGHNNKKFNGFNCLNFDSSTRNWLTLFEKFQLLDTKNETA